MHTFIGNLGHFFVIFSFVSALVAAFSYFKASTTNSFALQQQWKINGRIAFSTHIIAVLGIIFCLFTIIYNHYFEYHYAWSHSSTKLPTHYMISCFWEGQEGSFLLWLFWHSLLGVILIFTSKQWENKVMAIVSLVQGFLASMILGVVIPMLNFKIGSTPFILLRDALEAPIFTIQPNFIPQDGNGLNPLLQNYWMVIHPPVLFLGFATTLIPFAFCIAGLWEGNYKGWITPTLPWALFSAVALGIGTLMGGYWAYETLNFGGYWNWDPVENAVYVPWLILVASIHTMIIYKNSKTALKTSIILVIATFILILYSTFLTRSGILGNASVHSFTDLGLSGQLLVYLLFFTLVAVIIAKARWKDIPSSDKEISTYSREFWVFIGITILCLMGFQVLLPTSIPVYNALVESFGVVSNIAPPADQVGFYTKFQLWFAIGIATLSGTAQFFWWNKMDKSTLLDSLKTPLILTLMITTVSIVISGISNPIYMLFLVCGIYAIISNGNILLRILKVNPKLSGGAVAHVGVGLMLIGILASSGYSKVVSLNNTGLLISREADSEFNNENLLLFLNEPRTMTEYEITYRGDYVEDREHGIFINKNDIRNTKDAYKVIAKTTILHEKFEYYQENDTIEISPENTYYKIEYLDADSNLFMLYPRTQTNETMGLLSSPDIKRDLTKDLYTYVSSISNPDEPKEWTETEELEIAVNDNFFVNDYVATVTNMERIQKVEGVALSPEDVAVKANIKVQGETRDYFMQPIFIIKNGLVARIPDEISDLGLKITVLNIHPEKKTISLGYNTTQKSWIVMKALEKPLINVLWIGTLVLILGFSIAIYRRYNEFSASQPPFKHFSK